MNEAKTISLTAVPDTMTRDQFNEIVSKVSEPVIFVGVRKHEVFAAALHALSRDPDVYWEHNSETGRNGLVRVTRQGEVKDMQLSLLEQFFLPRSALWVKRVKGGKIQRTDVPKGIAKAILDYGYYTGYRVLRAASFTQIRREDQYELDTTGYDAQTMKLRCAKEEAHQ